MCCLQQHDFHFAPSGERVFLQSGFFSVKQTANPTDVVKQVGITDVPDKR
jgi:hypothetical protein